MKVEIKAIGAYAPEKIVTNDDLAQFVETNDEWIRSHTGIGQRHIAADNESTADLAIKASEIALKKAGITAKDLDLIVTATATPDYNGFPSTSCIIQHKLGADSATAFDVVAGCTGFIYAIDVAASLLATRQYKNALVIGAETLSKLINWDDRNTCVLFGDGAGAAILSKSTEDRIIESVLHSDGSGWDAIICQDGGSRNPINPENLKKAPYISMDGRRVYNFAVRVVTELITELIEKSGLKIEDFDYIVPHQANARIIQAAAKRLKLDENLFYLNIEEYANTSAASVPLALQEMEDKGLLKKDMLIMTLGFGAGLTYGGNIIRW